MVAFFGALRGGTHRPTVDALLERFDLDPTRPLRELSTGNRRKVGILQAFMHRPELVVLDEPTSGLDPLLQQQFNQLVREVVGEGATVFLSSHVLHEVELLADRVGVLRAGRLIRVATVAELRDQARRRIDLHLARPADAAAAGFSGLAGVVAAEAHGDVVRVVVEGDVDAVVKAVARLHVRTIVAPEGELEDVFLTFYGDGGG